jgi:hypothetical protein
VSKRADAARRVAALAVTSLTMAAAGLLVGGSAARAESSATAVERTVEAADKSDLTYVECRRRKNAGRFATLTPAGPGRLRVTGKVTPCRRTKRTDAFAIGTYSPDWSLGSVAKRGMIHYRHTRRGRFDRTVRLEPGTDRVCLATAPMQAHDCFAVEVRTRPDGRPGTPRALRRIPVRDANIAGTVPNCGSCW